MSRVFYDDFFIMPGGCGVVVSTTEVEEFLQRMKREAAMQAHALVRKKTHKGVAKKTERFTFKCSPALKQRIDEIAITRGISSSMLVVQLIQQGLQLSPSEYR